MENGFIIDLSNAKNAAAIIYELSTILEMPEAKDKNIYLKLGNIDLNRSQLLSIKALINSVDNELAFIDTHSAATEASAINEGIIVSELKSEIEIPSFAPCEIEFDEIEDMCGVDEPERTYVQMDIKDIKVEKHEEKSDEKLQTLYLEQTLRSGMTLSYDGNIVIIGDAHPGSEIIARGDVVVWGILGGIAHAGARGNAKAKIRALKMNAIQLRIAGHYARRPDTMNIPFIQKTDTYVPEEARVLNEHIVIYKLNEN